MSDIVTHGDSDRQSPNDTNRIHADGVYHCEARALFDALPDACVDLVLTDPPYGVGTQVSAWRSPKDRFPEIIGADEVNTNWLYAAYRTLKDGAALYVFAKWLNFSEWKLAVEDAGFSVKNCIIWDKQQHGTGDLHGAYAPQYEMVLFATKGRHLLRCRRPDVIRHPKVQPTNLIHPYEKPIGLLEKFILASSDKGALVVDCFAGSGSTGSAARNLNRRYLLCDIDLNHVRTARQRLAHPYTIDMFVATEEGGAE